MMSWGGFLRLVWSNQPRPEDVCGGSVLFDARRWIHRELARLQSEIRINDSGYIYSHIYRIHEFVEMGSLLCFSVLV